MFYSGFIFIDFRVKDLNPYSREELEIYKHKILLSYLTFYRVSSSSASTGYRLHSSENRISINQKLTIGPACSPPPAFFTLILEVGTRFVGHQVQIRKFRKNGYPCVCMQ